MGQQGTTSSSQAASFFRSDLWCLVITTLEDLQIALEASNPTPI